MTKLQARDYLVKLRARIENDDVEIVDMDDISEDLTNIICALSLKK